MELFSSCLDVWDVSEGFPDDVGEVGGDEQVGDFGMECVSGEECRGPVRVVVVQRAVVCLGSAEVPLELCRGGLEAFNWVCEVFAIWALKVMRVEWGGICQLGV